MIKKKHSKAEEDSKYSGTILGKGTEHGDVVVEGGEIGSIRLWQQRLMKDRQQQLADVLSRLPPTPNDEDEDRPRPPSSALSSLGDRIIGELGDEMDIT